MLKTNHSLKTNYLARRKLAKKLFNKAKHLSKEFIVFMVAFTLVCWSVSLPFTLFVPTVKAAGGIDAFYTDDGGATNDVYLNASSTPESILRITAYETQGGVNTVDSITLQLDAAMDCTGGGSCIESPFAITDLASLSTASTSGLSLWLDANSNSTFDLTQDTLISSTTLTKASDWSIQTIDDPMGGSWTVWQTTFSNLNISIPTTYGSLNIFVVAKAENNINADPLHRFYIDLPQYGVQVTAASGTTVSNWPTDPYGACFPPVTLGTEGGGDNMQYGAPVVISEVQIASSTADIEFIELYNRSSQSVDLFPDLNAGIVGADIAIPNDLNLHIINCVGSSCTGTTTNKALTLTTDNDTGDDIAANGYFLIASTAWRTAHQGVYGTPDATYDATTDGLQANGAVYISASSTAGQVLIDTVGWGSQTVTVEAMAATNPPTNGSIERKAYPNSSPTSMTTGIDSSKGNSEDTNNNSADFVTRPASAVLPQNTGSATESDTIAASERSIVINEVLYNTASSSSWVELYNASSTAISINAWTLEVATTTIQTYTIPNVLMEAASFVIIYWNQTDDNDTDTSDGIGSLYTTDKAGMSTYGSDITLKNGGTIIDYIQYGGSGKAGENAAASAGQWPAGDFKPNSEYNESIARMLEGTNVRDYNNSGDWMHMSTPTPGYPNAGGDSNAPTAVTNVVLVDSDTGADANHGLSGYDVRITWIPSTTYDSSFDRYELYLLPDGTALDQSQHDTYATLYGQYLYESGTASTSQVFVGYSDNSMMYDSAGTLLSTGDYRAYVVAVDMAGNRSAAVGSAPATLTEDLGGTDTIDPMIDHAGVWQASTGHDLTFYARMGDDRDQCNITTAELAYRVDNDEWGAATSTCTAPAMADNSCLKACSIAWNGAWNANTIIYYYLRAIDQAGNSTFVGMYPTSSESEAQNNPVDIDFVDSAIWDADDGIADITGTIYNESGSPIQDAFIILDGVATTTATTTSLGTFSFPDNSLYNSWQYIRVMKSGYMEMSRDVGRNSTGNNFYLGTGYMNTGTGGSAGGNGISWTGPMDGMTMAPTDISCTGDCSGNCSAANEMPIMVGFFNQMNANTIDDMDASNSGSNIYLTSDGNTKVAGIKVKYVNTGGMNEARIYSSTALSNDTFYTVVITPNVLDTNGNPIESNRPNGNYEFSFSTMSSDTGMWTSGYDNFGGGGMYMPPYVMGTNPTPGSFNVPLGAVLTIEFSETMDTASINTTNIKLYKVTNESSWIGTEVTDKNIGVSLDNATRKIVTVSHDTLDANASNNGWYEIRIMAAVRSQAGIWLGDPGSCGGVSPDTCLATQTHYTSSFQVAATSDTTTPIITGSYPSDNDGITSGTTPVDVAISSLEIGFSEAMNPSTINSQSVTLRKGTVSTAGTVSYDAMSNTAKFIPSSALTANSVYTLTASTSITDLSSNKLNISSGNNIINFKTGGADSTNPEILYANGDDYQIAITFTEPMNAAPRTDATNWLTSVLNIDNYITKHNYQQTAGNWITTGNPSAFASYDQDTNTVILQGLGTPDKFEAGYETWYVGTDYLVDLTPASVAGSGVTDKSGNPIANTTTFQMPIQASSDTYGMLGPGGGSGTMMSGGGPGGAAMGGGGPSMDMGQMGMYGAGAFPMNAMAGQTSGYMIDVPVINALQNGMQIILTFPTGFDVSAVRPDPYSSMNNDMNEWNGGTVTWDTGFGVNGIASTTLKVITMQLAVSTSSSNMLNTSAGPDGFVDFLAIDLKGIKNTAVAKDFGTSGYTVDIKTKSAAGALLENITTMPFFITEGGANTITVVVDCGNANQDTGAMNVFLGSPMTGPMEGETTTFQDGLATSTFTSLPDGDFMIFTDPFITIDGTNYMGNPMPEPFWVTGNTTRNITIEQEAANVGSNVAVSVYLQGNYATDSNNDGDNLDVTDADEVDIFANSPANFRVKTVTPITDDGTASDGDGNDDNNGDNTATNVKYTSYLTEGNWMMGVGIAMPKGPMAGPPKMPDWMEPQMVNMTVGIEAVTVVGGTAGVGDQNPVNLTVNSLDYFQVGDAISFTGTGAVDNNATTTITNINYANKIITAVPEDTWGAVPVATDVITSVRESSGGDNDTKVFFSVANQSLKQIQGYVVDNSGNGMGNAEVYAYQPQGGFGGAYTTSDTSGKFSLKVGMNGVWTIGAFKPGMPNSQEKSVEVRDDSGNELVDGNSTANVYFNGTLIADANNNNTGTNPLRLKLKRPGYTISGKVLNASSTAVAYAPVWAYQPNSWGHADTMTDSSGNYILYVDAGTWRIEADAPGVGWLQYGTDVTITNASQSNINLRPDTNTIFYSVSGTVTINDLVQTFMPLRASLYDANGNYQGRDYGASTDSNGQYTISLPAGLYRIDTWTPSFGEVELAYDQIANSPANINVNTATTTANITVAAADLRTISIQFTNGLANQTGFLHVDEMNFSNGYPQPTGYNFSIDISGLAATTTIKLKGTASNNYYFFGLDVPGYGSFMPDLASRELLGNPYDCIKVTNAARDVYFTLPNTTTEMITVAGTVATTGGGLADAWVWVGNPNSHYHTGTQSGSDGSFSLTVPVLSNGTYNLGADKPGYMSPIPAVVSGTASSTSNTITLTANTLTISGTVYTDTDGTSGYSTTTEALPNAWVWAESASGRQMTHSPADASGAYELGITNDTSWYIYAGADGYSENAYRVGNTKTAVAVANNTSVTGINIALSANSGWTVKTKSKPITPSSGGAVDDSGSTGTGVKVTIPPNALGSDSNSGNVSIQETSAVAKTTSAEPFGGIGKTITATDNSGSAITNLDDYIDVEVTYYKDDIASSSIVDHSKLKTLSLSYWDNSSDNWVDLSATRKAYYKTNATNTEWTLMPDNATTSQSGYEEFVDAVDGGTSYADYKLTFTGKTNHLTVFGATNPSDSVLPSAPSGLAQTSGAGTSVGLSWSAVTTNYSGSAITDLLGYEIYRSTDNSTYTQLNTSDIATSTSPTYTDSTTSAWTSYYYKITTADDGGNETLLASSTALQVCSTNSVSNGIVAADCTITCNSGYTQSGNSCVSSGGGGSVTVRQQQTQATEQEEGVTEEAQEVITEVEEVVDTVLQKAQEFAQRIITIASEAADVFKANVNALLGSLGINRDLAKEQVSVKKYVKALIKDVAGLPAQSQHALTNFITYGTETTLKLGEGERAGVVNSYKAAFGKLPIIEAEWNDVIKIANGRWPSQASTEVETNATASFKKIYLRAPDRTNPHDDAAVVVMAYGLRPADRNFDSERAGIRIFRAIYGYNPSTATAWDIVRAIAYSGATR